MAADPQDQAFAELVELTEEIGGYDQDQADAAAGLLMHDLFGDPDALHWARRFVHNRQLRLVSDGVDLAASEGAMLAWFAAAIETGRAAGQPSAWEADPVDRDVVPYAGETDLGSAGHVGVGTCDP